MSQLPITPAGAPQSGSGVNQSAAAEGGDGMDGVPGLAFGAVLTKQLEGEASLQSLASAVGSGDGLANLPGFNFGAALAKQLKGVASLREKKDDGISLAGTNESTAPAEVAGVALPSDLSVLTASMLVPTSSVQAGSGAGISVDDGADKSLMHLTMAGKAQVAAEIAASGKNLPQVSSSEQRFADKLVALADATAGGNAVGGLYSTGLSAAAVVNQKSESLSVVPRVGSAEWGGAVGEKVVWMANQSHQVAELHLNPPNLGPIEVRLTISNDQASAVFVSHQSVVREAIETALPRLREMLADNGIMLGNVTVGSESFSQQQAPDQRGGKEGGGRGESGAEGVMARMSGLGRPAGLMRDGMVDIFA